MESFRIKQVNQVILEELSQIIKRDIFIPDNVLVTILSVETSKDLLYSKVVVSVFPENKGVEIKAFLDNNIFNIQQFLNKKLAMRPVPKIRFEINKTEKEAERIEELLGQLKERGEFN